jgi:hypothetical protein
MKRFITLGLTTSAVALILSGNALPGAIPPQIQHALQDTQRNVIIILRDQMPNLPPARRAMGARAASLAASQNSVIAALPQLRLRKIHSFSTINAFSVTVTAAEADQLAAHPMVRAVVPDAVIQLPVRSKRSGEESTPGTSESAARTAATDGGLCNTLEPEALQLTHTAFADTSIPQAQRVRDGNGELVTGKGVKVRPSRDLSGQTARRCLSTTKTSPATRSGRQRPVAKPSATRVRLQPRTCQTVNP